jgi:hypothetical protein
MQKKDEMGLYELTLLMNIFPLRSLPTAPFEANASPLRSNGVFIFYFETVHSDVNHITP